MRFQPKLDNLNIVQEKKFYEKWTETLDIAGTMP